MFKLPDVKVPTYEEMVESATRWYSALDGVKLSDYNDILRSETLPFYEYPIPQWIVKGFLDLADCERSFESQLDAFNDQFEGCFDRFNGSSFFAKLNTRSPKDYIADCKFESTSGLVEALSQSMRCFEDFCMLYYIDKASLVLRPWVEIDKKTEFRVLVKKGQIAGISQYHYGEVFDYEDVDLIEAKIRAFVQWVGIPNMKVESFVMDLIVDDKCTIIETNPFGLSDPCLFNSYDRLDGSFLIN